MHWKNSPSKLQNTEVLNTVKLQLRAVRAALAPAGMPHDLPWPYPDCRRAITVADSPSTSSTNRIQKRGLWGRGGQTSGKKAKTKGHCILKLLRLFLKLLWLVSWLLSRTPRCSPTASPVRAAPSSKAQTHQGHWRETNPLWTGACQRRPSPSQIPLLCWTPRSRRGTAALPALPQPKVPLQRGKGAGSTALLGYSSADDWGSQQSKPFDLTDGSIASQIPALRNAIYQWARGPRGSPDELLLLHPPLHRTSPRYCGPLPVLSQCRALR